MKLTAYLSLLLLFAIAVVNQGCDPYTYDDGLGGGSGTGCLDEDEIDFMGSLVDAEDDGISNVTVIIGLNGIEVGRSVTDSDGEYEVSASAVTLQQAGANGSSDAFTAYFLQGQNQIGNSSTKSYSSDCDVDFEETVLGGSGGGGGGGTGCLEEDEITFMGLLVDAEDEGIANMTVLIGLNGIEVGRSVTDSDGEFEIIVSADVLMQNGANGNSDAYTAFFFQGQNQIGNSSTKSYNSDCEVDFEETVLNTGGGGGGGGGGSGCLDEEDYINFMGEVEASDDSDLEDEDLIGMRVDVLFNGQTVGSSSISSDLEFDFNISSNQLKAAGATGTASDYFQINIGNSKGSGSSSATLNADCEVNAGTILID